MAMAARFDNMTTRLTRTETFLSQRFLLVQAAVSLLMAVGCGEGGVGDPCIPEDEYRPGFSGYSKDEVNVESRSFQCETRVCLVHKFQGRVSCPYGQSNADVDDSGFNQRCMTPDLLIPISVAVPAQLAARRPSDAVYCSCRCAGPRDDAPYCECPSGFTCTELIDDIGIGNAQLAGSYCIKAGKDRPESDTSECNRSRGDCGDHDDPYQ